MRYYEIKRYAFEITDESVNRLIRDKFFNNLKPAESDEKRKAMYQGQKNFINSLRKQMEDGKSFEDIKEYRNKVMFVIAAPDENNTYAAIFFDKDKTDEMYLINMDLEKELLYITEGETIDE